MTPLSCAAATAPDCRFKRGLTLRYVLALGLVAGLALLSHSLFRHIMRTIERSAAITAINAAQRLLTQRVLAQCLLLSAADEEEARRDIRARLQQAVATLADNHTNLIAELDNPDSYVAHAPEVAAVYFKPPYELDKRMRLFVDNVRRFAQREHGRPALSDPTFLDVLAFGETELLRDLNAVGRAYQRQALSHLATLRSQETAATVAMLVLLLAIGICILRPMVRRICDDRTRLEAANAALTELAVTDQLTGAFNRLKFNEIMGRETRRTDRYATPMAVIMFDIDRFKRVNDVHGHGAGDAMLRELTRRVRGAIRSVDWLFRYGGEEFVVAAPHTNLAQGRALAEKLRVLVAGTPFPDGIAGSISLGVAELRPGESVESIMKRVDDALYEAKKTGRNRVVVAP